MLKETVKYAALAAGLAVVGFGLYWAYGQYQSNQAANAQANAVTNSSATLEDIQNQLQIASLLANGIAGSAAAPSTSTAIVTATPAAQTVLPSQTVESTTNA